MLIPTNLESLTCFNLTLLVSYDRKIPNNNRMPLCPNITPESENMVSEITSGSRRTDSVNGSDNIVKREVI